MCVYTEKVIHVLVPKSAPDQRSPKLARKGSQALSWDTIPQTDLKDSFVENA